MKYRKKPVVIEAVQFVESDPATWHPEIQRGGWDYEKNERFPLPKFWIGTLEGPHAVTDGDWIITGVKGETYPCKPDIFAMTYEPVVEDSPR